MPLILQMWKNKDQFYPGTPCSSPAPAPVLPSVQNHVHHQPINGIHISLSDAAISFSLPWSPAIPNTPSVITRIPPLLFFN